MLRALAVAVLGTIVVSCLLTPAVYALFEATMEEVPWPYSRVFDRVILVVMVIWLVRLRRSLELSALQPYVSELTEPSAWRRMGIAALVTLASALLALPLVVQGGTLNWHPNRTLGELVWKGVSLIPAGLIIGLIEEGFFRLVMFQGLRARFTTLGAALFSSLLYAVLHFLSPDKDYVFPGWSLTVGFEYLEAVGDKFVQPGVPGGVVGLTLVGLTLCVALVRSNSLALCIGLHAGWILAAKLAMKIARRAPGVEFPSGAGRRNYLVTQPAAWAAILLVMLGVWWVYRKRPARDLPPPPG